MIEILQEIFDYLLSNYALYLVAMMTLIIAITNTLLMFVKKPIKALTKLIKNEKLRKLANKVFILFAFGFSTLAWYILSLVSEYYFPFETVQVLMTGAFSIVIYAFGDGIVTKPTAKQLIETIKEIEEDKKLDENDNHAVEDFWKAVK